MELKSSIEFCNYKIKFVIHEFTSGLNGTKTVYIRCCDHQIWCDRCDRIECQKGQECTIRVITKIQSSKQKYKP